MAAWPEVPRRAADTMPSRRAGPSKVHNHQHHATGGAADAKLTAFADSRVAAAAAKKLLASVGAARAQRRRTSSTASSQANENIDVNTHATRSRKELPPPALRRERARDIRHLRGLGVGAFGLRIDAGRRWSAALSFLASGPA